MTRLRILTAACLLGASLSACGGGSTEDERFAYVEQPVETLYALGAERMERKRYDEAILYFEEVERQHPYSAWARRAMLMTAYAQYLTNDYEGSLAQIERFLAIHPGNKDAAYAYYLKAMNHYERIRDIGRDQDITKQALASLEDVVRRYPETSYARDAALKLDLTRDHLAGKEMDVGRWYLRQGQHVAALGRFNSVLTNYQTTSHVPEALHRSVEAYLQMGVVPEARRHAAVLGYNYPGSRWYEDTYALFQRRHLDLEVKPEESALLSR
jgi:outer membrane protein assembly factor BamD